MDTQNDLLVIEGLKKTFTMHITNTIIHACDHINLQLKEGEFIGITGKSGSGKSTILKGIYRTNLPQEGKILYHSEKFGLIDLCKATDRQMIYLRRHEIGYVSQFLKVMPRTTARQIIEHAVLEMGADKETAEKEAIRMLKHFELDPTLWDMYPNTFIEKYKKG